MRNIKDLFDPACLDLARYFLRDEPGMNGDDETELAKEIQQTVEDFIGDVKAWKRLGESTRDV